MENIQNIPLKSSTTERSFAFVCVAGMSLGTFAVGFFNPTTAGFFPACPLLSITGFACPGCGLTRGLHALLHGDILGALDYNLLMPMYLAFFGYLFISLFLTVVRGYGLKSNLLKPWMVWIFLVCSVVFAVLRNLPFYPFNILYP